MTPIDPGISFLELGAEVAFAIWLRRAMRDATIKMNDGTVHCAPIWYWRPEHGYLTLVGVQLAPQGDRTAAAERLGIPTDAIWLRDVAEAYEVRGPQPQRYDLLERARREGWDGR